MLTSLLAALSIYGHLEISVRVLLGILALVTAGIGLVTARAACVVTMDVVSVRFVGRTVSVPWNEIASINIAKVRGSETIRFTCTDDTVVDIPPSLLQSWRPITKLTAHRQLSGQAESVRALGGLTT